jgi:ABC-type glycerol-3-phosphate transport system substrate-binding protein
VTDLYPFARQAGVVDTRQFAMPFTADVLQVVYDNNALKSPPLNWTELYTNGIKYAFAAGDTSQVSDSFLAQYVALGGHFVDTRGRVALDRGPLRDALDFYRSTVSQSVAISNTLSIRTLDDSFRMFTSGRATVADVSARTFIREQPLLKNASYGSIPTREGNLATISRTWGMALVATGDPNRRVMAQRLIEYLAGVEIAAAWNRAAGQLPVRRTALGNWSSNITYRDFINQLMSVAVNRPLVTAGANLDGIMQAAVVDVLNNGLSPADAADKAIAALNR